MSARLSDLVPRFGLDGAPPGPPGTETRPSERALIIEAVAGHAGRRRARVAVFGLPSSWDGKLLLNARIETLAERKTFRPLLQSRCLVPATAYFEWRRGGRRRLKNRVAPLEGGLMAFAALTDGERFVIVTCAPASSIAHVHDRMPVIVEADREDAWLDPSVPFASIGNRLGSDAGRVLNATEETPKSRPPDLFNVLSAP